MTPSKKIRVVIADDFPILRQVIRRVIEQSDDMEVVGEAVNLQDTLASVNSGQPDVILLNDYLPPTDSACATKLLRESGVTAAILIISMSPEYKLIEQSFASGANGFMHKDEMGILLIDAIQVIYNQELYLSPKAKDALTSRDDEIDRL